MRSVRSLLRLTSALSIFLIASAHADYVVLKSGERVEGKIAEETDKTVTVQVQVSPAITDDRVIQKTDIVKISKASADDEAYKAIMNLQPGQNSLSSAQYTQILGYLNAFVTKFPKSPHADEINGTMKTFAVERKRVDEGEIKMRGAWLTKEQVAIQRVQVGGEFAFENMKSQSASGDFVGALDSFIQIEKTYVGASTYPEAIELAKQVIARLSPLVDAAIVNEKIDKQNLEKGWKDGTPKDRAEMKQAYAQSQAQAEAAAAYAAKIGAWPPFRKDSVKCLTALKTKIPTEYTRLLGLPVANFKQSVALSDKAVQQSAAGLEPEAKALVKEALALWPANEAAKRLGEELAQTKVAPATPTPPPPAAAPAKPARP
jgi:hypothetical protein